MNLERPFRFAGTDIGTLTGLDTPSDVGVVWLNAGAIRRTGPFRLHVNAARHFAALGFPTLRIDQPGIGDHVAIARRPQVDILSEMLDQMQAQTGCARFVVGGVCSAADVAWQLALKDSRVAGLLLLDPLARREAAGFRLGQFQLALARGPAGWIDMARRQLAKRGAASRATDIQLRDWPALGAEAAQLSALLARGAELFVLFTGGAASYFTHPRQFHSGYGPDSRNPRVRFDYWRHCDHLFFHPGDREQLIAAIARWLQERFGAAA
jgi:hypothetical protein